MLSRRDRLLLPGAGALLLVLGAAALGVSWWARGPGLDAEVNRLISVLGLRPGKTVADIGAGSGRMAVRMAQRLGPSSRVYATEIGAAKLQDIRDAATAAGVANITVLEAGEHATRLPDACCDAIYMRHVYHHLTDARAINSSLSAALQPGGRLAVIDFLSPRWMFFLHHGIPADVAVGQITGAGFVLEGRIEAWSPIGYCLVFRKAPGSARD